MTERIQGEGSRLTDGVNQQSSVLASETLGNLPIPIWQVDVADLRAVFDRLRREGVTDLDAHISRHDGFVGSALATAKVVVANACAAATFAGGSEADLIGAPLSRLWPPDGGAFRCAICAYFSGAESFSERVSLRDLEGRPMAAEAAVGFPTPGGPPVMVIGLTSVTSADDCDDTYRSVFLNIPVPLVRLDLSGNKLFLDQLRIEMKEGFLNHVENSPTFASRYVGLIQLREANLAAADLFGLKTPGLFPSSVADVWKTSPNTIRRACLARLRGEPGYSEETRIDTYDGRVKDVLFSVVFNDQVGASLGNVAAFIDVSDRVRTEVALENLRSDFAHAARLALVGELGGSIAHEVNQPLTAITASGELIERSLNREHPDLDFVRGLAADVVEDGRRASDIVSRIRAMVSKQTPVRQASSLNDVIADTIAFLHREFCSSETELHFEPAIDLPAVVIDRVQIQQVLVNV